MIINITKFFQKHDIRFPTEKSGVNWVRSLNPPTLVRTGTSYFVEEEELQELWRLYILKKRKLKKDQGERAKLNFKLKRKKETEL